MLLKELLEKEICLDVNSKLIDDWTALHLASSEGHPEIIKILIDHGANIEAETKMERRAIHIAALRGNLKVIEVLIERKASLNPQDKDLFTPLHYAAQAGYIDIIKILMENKANPFIKNYQSSTSLDLCYNVDTRKIFEEYIKDVDMNDSYGRVFTGDAVFPNSRGDHVMRMLMLNNQNKKSM